MAARRANGVLRSSRALALGALPLVGLIVVLGAGEYARQRADLLAGLAARADERHVAVALMLAETDRHLARLRLTLAEGLSAGDTLDPEALRPTAASLSGGTITALESGGATADGNLIAVPDLFARDPDALRFAGAARDMLRVARLEHAVGDVSHWSYAFAAGAEFIATVPGASLVDLAGPTDAALPLASLEDMIRRWQAYDVFALARPAANPARAAYWTGVYEDSGGAGAMVSHGAPVYDGDRFAGMVATDILLGRLAAALGTERTAGVLAIANDRGELLAATPGAEADLAFVAAIPAGPPGFVRSPDGWSYAKKFAGTPFRLVHHVGGSELALLLLPGLAPYAAILAGLALTLGGLLVLFHRRFVAPGFRLAAFVEAHAGGGTPTPPALPAAWRGHADAVAAAFATEREAARRLAASEARFLAATAALADGFAILDAAGRVVFANHAFRRHLDTAECAALDEGRPLPVAADGERRLDDGRWVSVARSGMAVGDVVVLRDVTEAKQAELALRHSEQRYRAVVETQTEFVVRFGADGRITFGNEAYVRYLGLPLETIMALPHGDFEFIHPDDRAANDAHIASLSPTTPTRTIQIRNILPDNSFHWEEWTDTGVFDAAGALVEIQSVGRDITEARATRDALAESEKLAALGRLLAGVAHELNNPLSIVVGYAGMLAELAEDPATARRAREVHTAAERCAKIVRTFLAMARSKPAQRRPVDLDAIVDDVLELATYGFRSAGLTLSRLRGDDLPPVLADPDRIHQVVMNVVVNAEQAMRASDGPRLLTIATGRDGDSVVVSVADTGPGMDAEVRRRAFEPFFTTKPQGEGTGIGLSVCLGIVESHGGTMRLDSAPGRGTTARIALPAATSPAVADAPPVTPEPGGFAGRLLVVDDEAAVAAFVAEALEREGIEVVAATDLDEALHFARMDTFDAVLTDLRMPGGGGAAFLARLRAERPELAARAVAMTGDALGPTPDLGAVPVIEKPLDLAVLRAALAPFLAVPDPTGAR